MTYTTRFVGIDISKSTLDICVLRDTEYGYSDHDAVIATAARVG